MRTATLFLLTAFLAWPALAQTDPSLVGNCAPRTAVAYLDVNNVRARIFNGSELFYGPPDGYSGGGLEIPIGSGHIAHYADNMWLGGLVNDEIRTSGSTYGPYEMWPGPIPSDGTPPKDCSASDRFWSLNREADLSDAKPGIRPTSAELNWPAALGAPYHEVDGVEGYSPEFGDRPMILGDQMHWWVMNDIGNEHAYSMSDPLGVEVTSAAFAFKEPRVLQETIFIRHTITNKSTHPIREMYIGRFLDVDLGAAFDDFVGTDSTLSLFYFYNSDNDDDGNYGEAPPALGLMILEASHSGGGLPTDISSPKSKFMTNSVHIYKGSNRNVPNPRDKFAIYNYLRSLQVGGGPIVEGGTGGNDDGIPTKFAYPGDPVTGTYWSDINSDGDGTQSSPWDRRGSASFGPFDLEPGESASFTFAYLWARGVSNLDSITRLRFVAENIHSASEAILSGASFTNRPKFVDNTPPERPQQSFWMDAPYPNPSTGRATIKYSLSMDGDADIAVYDVLSRKVASIHNGNQTAGRHEASIDTSNLKPGVYSIRLNSNRRSSSRLLTVVR
ncbi:T9SS type A sorting domain-containing protein [bacterium]|nr:T9SS type A sorting domain-containing protein [bacterium]